MGALVTDLSALPADQVVIHAEAKQDNGAEKGELPAQCFFVTFFFQ